MNPMSLQNLANFAMSIFVAIVRHLPRSPWPGPLLDGCGTGRAGSRRTAVRLGHDTNKRRHADDADFSADQKAGFHPWFKSAFVRAEIRVIRVPSLRLLNR